VREVGADYGVRGAGVGVGGGVRDLVLRRRKLGVGGGWGGRWSGRSREGCSVGWRGGRVGGVEWSERRGRTNFGELVDYVLPCSRGSFQ